jgi:hypothetical protein
MGIELGKPTTIPFGGLDLLREWLTRWRPTLRNYIIVKALYFLNQQHILTFILITKRVD